MSVTVLTASFNRAHTLERLYNSLIEQSDIEFEWLVVDDGSTDITGRLIEGFVNDGILDISYHHKLNQGKHSGLNVGFRISKGDWILVVDSDDWLDSDCVENVKKIIDVVRKDSEISSICMLQKDNNGLNVGSELNLNHHNYLEMIESNVTGDKCDVFRKSFVKKFWYPVFSGEKFMSEMPLYTYLGKISKTHFTNYGGYNCEYLNDGLSDNSINLRYNNIYSTIFVYTDLYVNSSSKVTKLRAAVNWWRFSIFNYYKTLKIQSSWHPPFILLPLGALVFVFDKIRRKI